MIKLNFKKMSTITIILLVTVLVTLIFFQAYLSYKLGRRIYSPEKGLERIALGLSISLTVLFIAIGANASLAIKITERWSYVILFLIGLSPIIVFIIFRYLGIRKNKIFKEKDYIFEL